MQWNSTENGGFCPQGVIPWLPVNPEYETGINAKDEEGEAGSMLDDYRRMIHFRQKTPALLIGDYQEVAAKPRGLLAYYRSAGSETCLIILNMTAQHRRFSLPSSIKNPRVGFATWQGRLDKPIQAELDLKPYEGLVLFVE